MRFIGFRSRATNITTTLWQQGKIYVHTRNICMHDGGMGWRCEIQAITTDTPRLASALAHRRRVHRKKFVTELCRRPHSVKASALYMLIFGSFGREELIRGTISGAMLGGFPRCGSTRQPVSTPRLTRCLPGVRQPSQHPHMENTRRWRRGASVSHWEDDQSRGACRWQRRAGGREDRAEGAHVEERRGEVMREGGGGGGHSSGLHCMAGGRRIITFK